MAMKTPMEMLGMVVCAVKGRHKWGRAYTDSRVIAKTDAGFVHSLARVKTCQRCALTKPIIPRKRKKVAEAGGE